MQQCRRGRRTIEVARRDLILEPFYKLVVTREGVFIFDGKMACFYRREDLLRWSQETQPAR